MGLEISRYNVRRAIQINASPHQVWHEFYDIRRMGAWFGVGQSLDLYDPGKDGRVELSIELDGEVQPFGGRIVVYDEDRELSFENNWFSEMAWPVPTMITLRLTANYEGTLATPSPRSAGCAVKAASATHPAKLLPPWAVSPPGSTEAS